MIGKALIGTSFKNCVTYCLDSKKDPEILGAEGLIVNTGIKDLIAQFDMVAQLNPGVSKPVWHSSISFAKDDAVNNELIGSIVDDYLKGLNANNHQYLIVKHNDTAHQHIHIILNRIDFEGKALRDWKSGYKTKKIMQRLESKYNLTKAMSQENLRKKAIATQIEKGLSAKESINQIFQRIESIGYKIQFNKTKKGVVRGVSFIDDEKGICFKSSAIKREYSYSKLLKKTISKKLNIQSKHLSR